MTLHDALRMTGSGVPLRSTGSAGFGAAERIREERFAADCGQRVSLKVEKLLGSGDAGIANVHTLIVSKLRTGCK